MLLVRVGNVALYVFVSPIAAIISAISAVVFGFPLYLAALSFFLAGFACALLIALGHLLFARFGTSGQAHNNRSIIIDTRNVAHGGEF